MDVEKILTQIEATPSLASARMAFGEPIQAGERVVIPVARVGGWFGLGFGRGMRPAAPSAEGAVEASGAGGGGGAVLAARPVAVIELTPDRVQVRPIVDVTRIALGGILLVAWNAFWLTRAFRASRRGQPGR
jgi:uncharacterized spore protein YtfJ